MPALEVDPASLPPTQRDDLLRLLAGPKILAEPEDGASLGWMFLAALGAAGFRALVFWKRRGGVASRWPTQGLWVLGLSALAAATLALGLARPTGAMRMARLPWKPGRSLTAEGFIDARRRPLRVRPI